MGRKFGFSFSWKRAAGISGLKSRISRKTGIPLTKYGRQRKIGRFIGGKSGCGCVVVVAFLLGAAAAAFAATWLLCP